MYVVYVKRLTLSNWLLQHQLKTSKKLLSLSEPLSINQTSWETAKIILKVQSLILPQNIFKRYFRLFSHTFSAECWIPSFTEFFLRGICISLEFLRELQYFLIIRLLRIFIRYLRNNCISIFLFSCISFLLTYIHVYSILFLSYSFLRIPVWVGTYTFCSYSLKCVGFSLISIKISAVRPSIDFTSGRFFVTEVFVCLFP